jgi:hypothetical protein
MARTADPRLVARKLRAVSKPATLVKVTSGARTPGALSGGTNPTSASYGCRAFASTTKREKINGTLVEEGDRIVAVLAATIASGQVPTTKDKLTFGGTTRPIVSVENDPFEAIYLCLTRGP